MTCRHSVHFVVYSFFGKFITTIGVHFLPFAIHFLDTVTWVEVVRTDMHSKVVAGGKSYL